MQTPEDPSHPDESSVAKSGRAGLLAVAGAVVAVAVVSGIAFRVSSKMPELKMKEFAMAGVRSLGSPGPSRGHSKMQECGTNLACGQSPGPLELVRAHPKMQAYGPGWQLHRPIDIAQYVRGAADAA